MSMSVVSNGPAGHRNYCALPFEARLLGPRICDKMLIFPGPTLKTHPLSHPAQRRTKYSTNEYYFYSQIKVEDADKIELSHQHSMRNTIKLLLSFSWFLTNTYLPFHCVPVFFARSLGKQLLPQKSKNITAPPPCPSFK